MAKNYSKDEITAIYKDIDNMSHFAMASLYRFAPSGHPYFDKNYPFNEYFMKRFNELGGWTPEISKEVGW